MTTTVGFPVDMACGRQELQRMVFVGYKAEIEILEHLKPCTLGNWIEARVCGKL